MLMNKPHAILFVGMSHDIYWYNRPCGPYKLATYLRRHGYNVQVIPNCTALTRKGYEQVMRKYASENLLWIGFSTNWLPGIKDQPYYDQWSEDKMLIDDPIWSWFYTDHVDKKKYLGCIYDTNKFREIWSMAKEYNSQCQLVFGGSILSRNPFFTPEHLVPEATYIKHNAEVALLEYTQRLGEGNLSIDNLPSNDEYDLTDFKFSFIEYTDNDHIESHEWLPIEISRGCAFKCAFCNYDMKGVTDNYVNPSYLREEIIKMYNKHGTTNFVIMDDLYNDDRTKVKELYEKCWSRLPFKPQLAGYLRLDLIWNRPDQARLLLDSGWRAASFGIETLHDNAGRSVGKGVGKKRILETLELLKKEWQDQIFIHGFFIAGLPHEPMESLEETDKWLGSTDLVHGVIWHYLEVAKDDASTLKKLERASAISTNNSKYGYKFIDIKEWVSNVGLTFSQAAEFVRKANLSKVNMFFTRYADMRALGISHDEILDICKHGDHYRGLLWENGIKTKTCRERLLKIIGINE